MGLDKKERLILANQYRILALIDSENAEEHEHWRKALEEGYELAYSQLFDQIYDGLTETECDFVVEVLAMYDALQRSHKEVGKGAGIKASDVAFPGFDGNNETPQMAYARFIIRQEGRFDYLTLANKDLNSHFTSIEVYQRMLDAWNGHDRAYELSAVAVRDIIAARIHPSRRGGGTDLQIQ